MAVELPLLGVFGEARFTEAFSAERTVGANLEVDGGLIMAEALMMQLAPILGRNEAHGTVYDLTASARAAGRPLADAAGEFLAGRGIEADFRLQPADYLGEAPTAVDTAVDRWRNTHRPKLSA